MGIFEKLFGNKKQSGEIRHSKVPFYIPDFDSFDNFNQISSIFEFVFYPNFSIACKAAKAIHKLFNSVTVYQNKQMYNTFRYLAINPSDLKLFDRFDLELKTTLLSIASMNGNGYSREAALVQLAAIKTQRSIPFVIFRLADWVSPIRMKAEAIFKELITDENRLYFFQNYKLINWMLKVERTDLAGLLNEISKVLTSEPLKSEELNTLTDGERFVYFSLFVQQEKHDSKLFSQMLNDKYYLVRLIVIKNINKLTNRKEILLRLLSDKSQKIRLFAIKTIQDQEIEYFRSILLILISDSSSIIRHHSRELLDKIEKHNYSQIYKANLNNQKQIAASVLGLSEVGDQSDIDTIKPYLNSDKATIRSAALSAIFNLNRELSVSISYEVIQNANPTKTKRIAEFILSTQGIDYNRLRQIYDKTDITGKKVILKLFNRFSSWSVAGDFLKALTENDNTLSHMAVSYLDNWRFYTMRLATSQKPADKDYVMGWYKKAKEMGLTVQEDIPFIFGEK